MGILTKVLSEAPDMLSLMRYAVLVVLWTYVGVVAVIIGVWTYKAVTGDPNWVFAEIFTGIVGTTVMLGLVTKVFQKKIEVHGEVQEMITKSDQQIQQGITAKAEEVSK